MYILGMSRFCVFGFSVWGIWSTEFQFLSLAFD